MSYSMDISRPEEGVCSLSSPAFISFGSTSSSCCSRLASYAWGNGGSIVTAQEATEKVQVLL